MSATSFLFQGQPPANINTTSSESATLPTWYQEYLQGLMGTANALAATPYPQYGGPTVAAFNPTQTQAFDMTGALPSQTSGALGAASGALGSASSVNIPGAVNPYLSASTSTAYNPSNALNPYNSTATNYLNQATNTLTPGGIQSYMSPYTQSVVQNLQNTANQNWNNTIMPSIQNEFISGGQFGSGRNAQVLGQAANTFQQNLEGQEANALETGYGEAGSLAGNQANILGSAANTSLGQGTAAGSAAGQEAGLLQSAGSLAGTAAQQQGALDTSIAAGNTNLANSQQNIALQNAAAEQTVGNQQQSQDQANLTAAQTAFNNQAAYPEQQASFLSDIIRGLQVPTSTSVNSNQAPNPLTSLSPSTGNQLAALFGTGTQGAKEGGLIKMAKGGPVPRANVPGMLAAHPSVAVPPPGKEKQLSNGIIQHANGDITIPYRVLQMIGLKLKAAHGMPPQGGAQPPAAPGPAMPPRGGALPGGRPVMPPPQAAPAMRGALPAGAM